ncbi:MAG: hypothetical protein ACXVOH_05065 [Bacteroidia bacterium]
MRAIALFLSYVLHPVFALTWLISFFVFTQNYFSYFMIPAKKVFLLAAVFIFTVVLPLLNTYILKKFGYVKDLHMGTSQERFMPYVSTFVLHLGLLYILHDLAVPSFFKFIILASALVILVLIILNFFTKVSAHATSAGGLFGSICFYEFISYQPVLLPICLCLVFCGLSGFARLYLKEHTEKQVYLGFAAGTVTSLACLFSMLFINYQF